MTWLFWLVLVVIITAVAGVVGFKPTGGRPIAQTKMMAMARFVLLAAIVIFAYLALRSR